MGVGPKIPKKVFSSHRLWAIVSSQFSTLMHSFIESYTEKLN